MADRITYVGLDVNKESIVVAVAAGGLHGAQEARPHGEASKCQWNQRDGIWTRVHHRGMPKPRHFPFSCASWVVSP